MKRGDGLRRSTPLQAHTELRRSSELPRSTPLPRTSPPLRSVPAGSSRTPSTGRPRGTSRSTDVPTRVRRAVYERDGNRCGRCGRDVWAGIRSLQHRDPRGAGGGGPDRHAMSNLVTVCGLLSTDPQFCHYWCESQRTRAQASGFLVPAGIAPCEWAIHMHDGWWLLDDDGGRTATGPYGATDDEGDEG